VDVTKEEGVVESSQPVPDSHNVPPDMEEMILAEQALLSHPEFKAAVAKLDLPSNATVVADGWIYGGSTVLLRVVLTSLGADKFEKSQRYISFMVYLSFSDDPDTCHYAAPLPLVPVIDAEDFTLVEIEYTPILGTGDKTLLDLGERFPWEKYTPNEYDAGIRQAAGLSTRGDLKPYRVVQPEGASVSMP
jgi:primary-amine oxidase